MKRVLWNSVPPNVLFVEGWAEFWRYEQVKVLSPAETFIGLDDKPPAIVAKPYL